MSLTVVCGLCSPPLDLGTFEDFWEGQAVLHSHTDEHLALIPLSAIAGSHDLETGEQ